MRFVVFDLDGVLLETPQIKYGADHIDWGWYWTNPDVQEPNQEMVDLLWSLNRVGMNTIILTARPEEVVDPTMEVLRRLNVGVTLVGVDWNIPRFAGSIVLLRMCDVDLSKGFWQGAGVWKRETLKDLIDSGHQVDFVVEDYKESADEIRKIVPVLLYEHYRP